MDTKKMMDRNVGSSERILRIGLGVIVLNAYALGYASGLMGYAVLAVSVLLMFTGVSGWCPLYALAGINTIPKDNGKKK